MRVEGDDPWSLFRIDYRSQVKFRQQKKIHRENPSSKMDSRGVRAFSTRMSNEDCEKTKIKGTSRVFFGRREEKSRDNNSLLISAARVSKEEGDHLDNFPPHLPEIPFAVFAITYEGRVRARWNIHQTNTRNF